jgi:hypothetical protein
VAVGDEEFFVGHGGGAEIDEAGVGELPDAVDYAVFVGYRKVGGVGVLIFLAVRFVGSEDEFFGGEGGVGIEHVDLLAVGAGGFEEGEAVGFVLGEGLLVAVDYFFGVVVEVAEGDEAAAFAGFGFSSRATASGDGVGLGVAVDGGLGLFGEDAVFAPGIEIFGGAGVDVWAFSPGGRNSWGSVSPGSCLPRITRMRL